MNIHQFQESEVLETTSTNIQQYIIVKKINGYC